MFQCIQQAIFTNSILNKQCVLKQNPLIVILYSFWFISPFAKKEATAVVFVDWGICLRCKSKQFMKSFRVFLQETGFKMKLTVIFISVVGLVLTVEGLFFYSTCESSCFSSPVSHYRLTMTRSNYSDAVQWCKRKMFYDLDPTFQLILQYNYLLLTLYCTRKPVYKITFTFLDK